MYFLYSFFFTAWIVFMAPFFLWNAWKRKKYLPALRQRLGFLADALRFDGRPTIWIHSCSVGETLSVAPLALLLSERFPDARLVFSTITKTGQAIAQDRFSRYGGLTFYFPIDLAFIARRVLDWIQPTMLVMVETEIWPNVIRECRRRKVPVVMINGRVSAESFQYYQWVQPALGQVFRNYELLLMKAKEDAARVQRMGAPPSKILVSGSIKYDRSLVEKDVTDAQAKALDDALGLTNFDGPLIVAGSTHDDEEATLLDVLARLKKIPTLEKTQLMLVPRHPDRFAAVAQLAEKSGFRVKRRTSPFVGDADVLVLDTLGELSTAYQFATVVFVGGTLIPHGGQSIMEPAVYAKPIVIGPSMLNFPGTIDDFRAVGGVSQIAADQTDKDAQKRQLTEAFSALLLDSDTRAAMGAAAQSVFEGSRGATAFTVEHLAAIFEKAVQK